MRETIVRLYVEAEVHDGLNDAQIEDAVKHAVRRLQQGRNSGGEGMPVVPRRHEIITIERVWRPPASDDIG